MPEEEIMNVSVLKQFRWLSVGGMVLLVVVVPSLLFMFRLLWLGVNLLADIFAFEAVVVSLAVGLLPALWFLARRLPDLGPVEHQPSLRQAHPWAYDDLALIVEQGPRALPDDIRERYRVAFVRALQARGSERSVSEAILKALDDGDLDPAASTLGSEDLARSARAWLVPGAARNVTTSFQDLVSILNLEPTEALPR